MDATSFPAVKAASVNSTLSSHKGSHKDSDFEAGPTDSTSVGSNSMLDTVKKTGRGIKEWIKSNIVGEEADYKTLCKMKKIVALGASGGGAVGAASGYVYGLMNENSNKVNEAWDTHDVNDPVKLLGWSHKCIEDGHTESHTYYTLESVSHTSYDSEGHSYTYYTSELKAVTYYTYEHDGYWHRNFPNIEWKKVGEYETPKLVREKAIGPIEGAAIGLGVGIVLGTVIGVINAQIYKIIAQKKEGVI